MRGLWQCSLITCAVLLASAEATSPAVKVQVRAPWRKANLSHHGSPLLLEIFEAANSQQPESFFPLVTQMTAPWSGQEDDAHHKRKHKGKHQLQYSGLSLAAHSDRDLTSRAEKVIREHDLFDNVNASVQFWKQSLALHDQSPRVQAFMQFYNTLKLQDRWDHKVSSWKGGAESCISWVDFQDSILCDEDEVVSAIEETSGSTESVRLLPFDHVLPARENAGPVSGTTLILYGDPYSSNFWRLHSLLEAYASGKHKAKTEVRINYVLRWRPYARESNATSLTETLFLSGYGAILDLKKVDYLVIDDRKLKDDSHVGQGQDDSADPHSSESQVLSGLERYWMEEQIGQPAVQKDAQDLLATLSKEQLHDLGIRAAHVIAASSDPLRALVELSQNFPLYASAIAHSESLADWDSSDLVDSLVSMSERRLEPGASDAWLNGKSLSDKELDPLGLLKVLRDERKLVQPLLSNMAGSILNESETVDLLSSSLLGQSFLSASDEDKTQAFFDASDRKEREGDISAITWWNDLANDAKTAHWSKDLFNLLRPMWPGQFPQLSLNLFNVIMVMDLSRRESCKFLSESIGPSASAGKVGLHWGVVPGGLGSEEGVRMARLYWEILQHGGTEAATKFLRKVANSKAGSDLHVDLATARKEAALALYSHIEPEGIESRLEDVINGKFPELQTREKLSRSYVERLRAVESESPRGHVFINGQHLPFNSQLIQMLHQTVQDQIQMLAPKIYYKQLANDDEGLETWFYDQPGTLKFRSKLANPPTLNDGPPNSGIKFSNGDIVSALSALKGQDGNVETLIKYLYPDQETRINSTVWLVGDLDSADGSSLVRKATKAMQVSEGFNAFRLGFLHVPSSVPTETMGFSGPPLSAFLHQIMQDGSIESLAPAQLIEAMTSYAPPRENLDSSYEIGSEQRVLKEEGEEKNPARAASEKGWAVPGVSVASMFWEQVGQHVAKTIGASDLKGPAIVVNRKMVSGFEADEISSDDILALLDIEASKKVVPIVKALSMIRDDLGELSRGTHADLVSAAVSVLSSAYAIDEAAEGVFVSSAKSRTAIIDTIGTDAHVVEVGDRHTASFRFSIVLDPVSEPAQKWSSILSTLSQMEGVYIRIVLNPRLTYEEMPLKRFYRFSAPLEMQFDEEGKEVVEELRFHGMPENAVLTLGLDAIPTWLTMPEEAVYDLDNIRLSDVPTSSRGRGVKAMYELKHILIEGHARDVRGPIPRGLQLVLETPDETKILDTIVMANLAYLQFKAQPGLWKLRIREGRTQQLYEMVSVGNVGWNSPEVEVTGNDITLDTLTGLTIYPRVQKRKGMEKEDLLEELDAQDQHVRAASNAGGAFGFAKSALHAIKDKVSSKSLTHSPHADINIFTVASGHLYERMTYIMILSVIRHTNSSVKFWFIENFLSPSFKEFIPHLAQEYGFQYELVTYAWPHWLRAQKEKQRTIWGYKILFLDTLFPLDLSKVIFVDADQVVRTDLKELVDTDLQGAPYGYPPMGDDSEDMDGFRFWKHGYWKDYLRGRPYHISALYVVDLNKFRQVAAGDRMRGQYQALSADPNSLANLDQDLPNNLQFQLPIHTLDKTWLWCETWCSNDWLPQAKTIDLCSNPKTKEPKLDRARRQIPEWTAYDDEIASLAKRLAEQKRIGDNMVNPEKVETASPHDEL